MGDGNEDWSRDAVPSRGSRLGGNDVNADEFRNFMPIFRSALNRVDNIDSAHDQPLSDLSTSNPLRARSTLTLSSAGRRSGYDSYSGFRPEGLLRLAMGLSSSPYMPGGHGYLDFNEEGFYESGPDFQQFSYTRSIRQRTAFGQRSSRVDVQMMGGLMGFGFQAVRSSRFSEQQSQAGRTSLANPLLQLLMLPHDEYCPIHGTGQHHHHLHHDHHATHRTKESNDDKYTGPIITEIDDEGNDVDEGRTLALLPLDGPNVCSESIRSEKDKKKNKNKNQVCRRKNLKWPADDEGRTTVSDVSNRKDGIEQDEASQSTFKPASLQEIKGPTKHAQGSREMDEVSNQQGHYEERYVQKENEVSQEKKLNARSELSLDVTTSRISHEFVHEKEHLSPSLDMPKSMTDDTFAQENLHMECKALSPKTKGNADATNGILRNINNIDALKSERDEGKTKPSHDETLTCGDTKNRNADPTVGKPEDENPIHRNDHSLENQQVNDDSDALLFTRRNRINDDYAKEVTGTTIKSFYQMVQRRLPRIEDTEMFDDIKFGGNGEHEPIPNDTSQFSNPQTNPVLQREKVEGVTCDLLDAVSILSNEATTNRKQDSMPKRSFVNKNKTPQIKKTNVCQEQQAANSNMSTYPKLPKHVSVAANSNISTYPKLPKHVSASANAEEKHGSKKETHDSSTSERPTGLNSFSSDHVKPFPGPHTNTVGVMMPNDESSESLHKKDIQSKGTSGFLSDGSPSEHVHMHHQTDNLNTKGRHHSVKCTESGTVYDTYAKKCMDCKRIHIYCENCDTVLRTLCGKCEGCKKQLSFLKPQSQNFSENHPMSTTGYHEGHHPNGHGRIADGDNNNTMNNKEEMYKWNDHVDLHHSQNSYEQQVLYQKQNNARSNTHGDASYKYSQGQERDSISRRSMQNELHQGQHIPCKESVTSNDISTGLARTYSWPGGCPNHPIDSNTIDELGVLEEQHPQDDPLDHPEWQHLKDVESWNFPESSPKKPPRNKNLHVGKSTSTGLPSGSGSRVMVRATTSTPNFTTSSAGLHGNDTGASGMTSYPSDYNDNDSYQKQGGSSSDRISSLSDAMLERGMVVKDVYPDGNCFFAAVVDQLRVRGEFFYTARSLRKEAVNYLRNHPKQADGTPLLDFVPDHDTTTWEGYLTRLDRDGEWADHIIISAITNVLKRCLVIHSIRRSDKQVNTTIMEPEMVVRSRVRKRPTSDSDGHAHAQADSLSISGEDSGSEGEADFELYEDLQLGHIPEAHYVSLRYIDWENRLYTSLKTRKDDPSSHVTNYGKLSTRKLGEAIDTSTDGAIVPEIPWLHYEFLVRYLQTSNYTVRCPLANNGKSNLTVTYPFDGLCCRAIKTKQRSNWSESTHHRENTYGETDYTPNCGRAERKDGGSDFSTVTSFFSPPDTYVHQERNKEMKPVDLFCESQGCPPGYTKLRPITKCWFSTLTQVDGTHYLKHLTIKGENFQRTKIAFRCELPDRALEWFERERVYEWPSTGFIERLQNSYTCLVSAQSHSCSIHPSIEWKFCFESMEHSLVKDEVTESQKKGFDIFQCLLAHVFPSGPIHYDHLKQVFFYICERVNPQDWDTRPSNCLQSMMELLLDSFLQDHLPNYFFSDVNTIDYLTKAEKDSCIESIQILVAYPFTMLYFMLDRYKEISYHSEIITIDSLIEDVQTYAVDRDHVRTLKGCFLPLSVRGISSLVSLRYFSHALDSSRTAVQHLNTMLDQPSFLSFEDFLYQVLYNVPNESIRWMFALFLDQTIKSSFLAMVNAGHETVSLFRILGLDLKDSFDNCTTGDIRVPKSFTEPGLLVTFIKDLVEVLETEMDVEGVVLADSLTYWFKRYTNVVERYMSTCSKAQQNVISTQFDFLLEKKAYYTLKQECSTLRSLLGSFGRV